MANKTETGGCCLFVGLLILAWANSFGAPSAFARGGGGLGNGGGHGQGFWRTGPGVASSPNGPSTTRPEAYDFSSPQFNLSVRKAPAAGAAPQRAPNPTPQQQQQPAQESNFWSQVKNGFGLFGSE